MDPIKIDPEIMGGTPCFAGTRVPIKNLFDYLRNGHTLDVFLDHFPSVCREHALSVIEIAAGRLLASLPRVAPAPLVFDSAE